MLDNISDPLSIQLLYHKQTTQHIVTLALTFTWNVRHSRLYKINAEHILMWMTVIIISRYTYANKCMW